MGVIPAAGIIIVIVHFDCLRASAKILLVQPLLCAACFSGGDGW